jgi:hypothetical protein
LGGKSCQGRQPPKAGAAGPPLQGLPPSHTRPPSSTAGNISSDGCLKTGPQYNSTARATYADQADEDWRGFLNSRGRELRNGGQLIVITMALRDDGDFGLRPLVKAMYDALLGLVDEGFVG